MSCDSLIVSSASGFITTFITIFMRFITMFFPNGLSARAPASECTFIPQAIQNDPNHILTCGRTDPLQI